MKYKNTALISMNTVSLALLIACSPSNISQSVDIRGSSTHTSVNSPPSSVPVTSPTPSGNQSPNPQPVVSATPEPNETPSPVVNPPVNPEPNNTPSPIATPPVDPKPEQTPVAEQTPTPVQTPESPLIGNVKLSSATYVQLSGSYVYVANRDPAMVYGFDASDPQNLKQVSTISSSETSNFSAFTIAGDYAYIPGAGTYNITNNRMSPLKLSNWPTKFAHISGNYATMFRLGAFNHPLISLYDISNITSPRYITEASARQIGEPSVLSGDYIYASYVYDPTRSQLTVTDISDKTQAPKSVGSVIIPNSESSAISGIALYKNYAILAYQNGIAVINVNNPSNPTHVTTLGFIPNGGSATAIAISGQKAYVSSFFPGNPGTYSSGIHVIDLGTPGQPLLSKSLTNIDLGFVRNIAISGNHAYLASDTKGLNVIDLTKL